MTNASIMKEPFEFASPFSIIASCSTHGGLAYQGHIPWEPICIADARFITTISAYCDNPVLINAVIMDHMMWRRIGQRPLKWRCNVIIESPIDQGSRLYSNIDRASDNLIFVNSLDEALATLASKGNIGYVYVLGGDKLLADALIHPRCSKALLAFVSYIGHFDEFFDFNSLKALYNVEEQTNKQVQSVRDGMYTVQFMTYRRKFPNIHA